MVIFVTILTQDFFLLKVAYTRYAWRTLVRRVDAVYYSSPRIIRATLNQISEPLRGARPTFWKPLYHTILSPSHTRNTRYLKIHLHRLKCILRHSWDDFESAVASRTIYPLPIFMIQIGMQRGAGKQAQIMSLFGGECDRSVYCDDQSRDSQRHM
jgi:hypothetical protein